MGSEQDRVRELAERVARRLDTSAQDAGGTTEHISSPDDIAALRAGLSEIQRRLAHIESHIAHDEDCEHGARQQQQQREARTDATPARSTWLSGTYVPATTPHPSQEKFAGIGEAVAELVDFFESEKTCNVEPGAKPCDHCGMCSSRGF
jgi:chromosome segregation ATPase